MGTPIGDPTETERTWYRLRQGGDKALNEELESHRERLRRMVLLRMDRRIQGRLDASDVVQDAYLEAMTRLETYLGRPKTSFFLWLRYLTAQRLLQLHRFHLGARARDAGRELSIYAGTGPEPTSAALAARLVGKEISPSDAAVRAERKVQLEEVLNRMRPEDREVIALRHYEQLSGAETAEVLGISEGAASMRYLRAMKRLREEFTPSEGASGTDAP